MDFRLHDCGRIQQVFRHYAIGALQTKFTALRNVIETFLNWNRVSDDFYGKEKPIRYRRVKLIGTANNISVDAFIPRIINASFLS